MSTSKYSLAEGMFKEFLSLPDLETRTKFFEQLDVHWQFELFRQFLYHSEQLGGIYIEHFFKKLDMKLQFDFFKKFPPHLHAPLFKELLRGLTDLELSVELFKQLNLEKQWYLFIELGSDLQLVLFERLDLDSQLSFIRFANVKHFPRNELLLHLLNRLSSNLLLKILKQLDWYFFAELDWSLQVCLFRKLDLGTQKHILKRLIRRYPPVLQFTTPDPHPDTLWFKLYILLDENSQIYLFHQLDDVSQAYIKFRIPSWLYNKIFNK